MPRIVFALTALLSSVALFATVASADSTPIGKIPPGPVTTIVTPKNGLVAVALPHQKAGLVWRLARSVNPRVLRQVSEADIGSNVVIVYKAVGVGNVSVIYAVTRGDTSSKALRSSTYKVRVTT
jgi:hypothetical protein